MKTRRSVALIAVAAMVFAISAAPAIAGKRKKPPAPTPVDLTFWLRNQTNPAACTEEALQLLLSDGPDTGSCGSAFSGPVNEILFQAGDEPSGITYQAAEGLPFLLDASKEIKGTIVVSTHRGNAANTMVGPSAGPTTFVITLTGTINGESKVIAEGSYDYTVTPDKQYVPVEIALKPDAALDKQSVTTLELTMYNRGVAPLHGFYKTEDPASSFTIGALE